jgi:hypothetical protein
MQIVTSHVSPPIGIRGYDWTASFDGDSEGLTGYGPTEEEAIESLRHQAECELLEAAECAANVLSLLDKEVRALGCNARNVLPRLRAALAKSCARIPHSPHSQD